MFMTMIIAVFLAPIIITQLPNTVEGDFDRWMRTASIYTLTLAILVLVAPVVLEVINPQWFEEYKDLMVNDVILNLKERSRTSMVLCYVARQIAIAVSAGAICLAGAHLASRRHSKHASVLVSGCIWLLVVILSFQMPLDNGEFYQKLFVAIDWGAEHIWYFVTGILSFSAGILVRSVKR